MSETDEMRELDAEIEAALAVLNPGQRKLALILGGGDGGQRGCYGR